MGLPIQVRVPLRPLFMRATLERSARRVKRSGTAATPLGGAFALRLVIADNPWMRAAAVFGFASLLAAVGCGGDETGSGSTTTAVVDAGTGGGGGSAATAGARLICAPGELPHDDGACEAPGVPADGCGQGFVADGESGCAATMPAAPCAAGQMALPGETTCRAVALCGGGPWGDAPVEADTQYVDAAYAGGGSDGTQAKPWTTVQAGVDAAAPGAVVAIAAGSYGENVFVDTPVRLWGACPAQVTLGNASGAPAITVTGAAAGAELHDLAVTGAGLGLYVVGASGVVADRVWIHDTGSTGLIVTESGAPSEVALRRSLVEGAHVVGAAVVGSKLDVEDSILRGTQSDSAGAFGRGVSAEHGTNGAATVSLRRCLVEGHREVGLLALGSTLAIEDTLVRDTSPRESDQGLGAGVEALAWPTVAERSSVVLTGSVIERSHFCGACAEDSELSLERTVVRDTSPQASDDLFGFGVRVYGVNTGAADRPVGSIRASLIERSHLIGLAVVGAEATIETTVVRDTEPRASDGEFGRGVSVEVSYDSGQPSRATLRGVAVARSHEVGLFVVGSEADVDAAWVVDTQPRASDASFGIGVGFSTDIFTQQSARGTFRRSVVERGHVAGLIVAGAEVGVSDVVIRDVAPRPEGDFGDGIIASSTLVVVPGVFPTTVDVDHASVERNARAGVGSFGATITLSATALACNAVDLDGEIVQGEPFVLEDRGDNVCACDATTVPCRVLSSNFEPPAPMAL